MPNRKSKNHEHAYYEQQAYKAEKAKARRHARHMKKHPNDLQIVK